MPAATIFRSALPGAGVDTDSVDLDLDDLDDADGIGALACGRTTFSYHRIPDRDLDLDEDARTAGADCIGALTCGRASFSYHRLPEPLLHLTIRKLDGSCFDVQIERSATVWELRATIEGVFIAMYGGREEDIISWQHVWSHFCLCFKDEKLTDDKVTLRACGIKDGDELHFVQHLSVDYSPCKSSKSQRVASHRRSRTSLDDFGRSRTLLDNLNEEDEGGEGEMKLANRHSTSVLEEGLGVYQPHVECLEEGLGVYQPHLECLEEGLGVYQPHVECLEEGRKKGSFFRGLFSSYSRLRSNRRTHSEDAARSSCEKKSTRPKLGKWLSFKKSKEKSK